MPTCHLQLGVVTAPPFGPPVTRRICRRACPQEGKIRAVTVAREASADLSIFRLVACRNRRWPHLAAGNLLLVNLAATQERQGPCAVSPSLSVWVLKNRPPGHLLSQAGTIVRGSRKICKSVAVTKTMYKYSTDLRAPYGAIPTSRMPKHILHREILKLTAGRIQV